MAGTEATAQLKMLKQARNKVLKDWDVSFAINGEVLINIIGFITDINTEVPMKFYEDKIFVHLKSPDNIQYAEVEISSSDVLDYRPGLNGDPNRKDAKSVIKGSDGDYKAVLIDMRGTLDEIETFAQKDDIVIVRIDTAYYKRIEFHCPGNVVIWAQLIDPSSVLKNLEKIPEIIRKVRNNPDIQKASAIIEPATFARICSIGGKGGKKRDIDERIFIELDKKDGLYITSGDKLKGRFFELKPADDMDMRDIAMEDMGMGGDADIGGVDMADMDMEVTVVEKDISDMEEEDVKINMGAEAGADNDGKDDDAGSMDMGFGNVSSGGFDSLNDEGMEEGEFAFARSESDVNNKKKETKRSDQKTQLDQLLGIDVDSTQYVYLGKEFITPFTKLKGLSPIVIEVRTDKPIILQQKPYNGISALLSVAPRIEDEDR